MLRECNGDVVDSDATCNEDISLPGRELIRDQTSCSDTARVLSEIVAEYVRTTGLETNLRGQGFER